MDGHVWNRQSGEPAVDGVAGDVTGRHVVEADHVRRTVTAKGDVEAIDTLVRAVKP
jgi:hypothetical protein